jgi:hypothetical protein
MARKYEPEFRFVLTDKTTHRFPRIDKGLANDRLLTDSLEFTYIFDDRDNPELKKSYYNAIYKGVADFEIFKF